MSRPNPLILLAIIAVSTVIMAGVAIRPGALMISAHEGDTYHLLDIIFRMDRGLEPHQDFVTPIGVLAFLPILWFIEGGYGVGTAILFSQLLVAVALIIPIWYTASSRLSARTGYLFAAVSMITVLALVYGGSEPGLSISMHYNRWAWAIAYILVVLALVPGRGFKWLDGLLFGLGLSALVLLKITFFVALLPGIALALILRRDAQTMLVAAVTGAVVAIGVTVFLGFGFWTGYVGDLANVAASEVRPYAGVTLTGLISEPSSMIAIALGLCAYLFLSRSGQRNAALALILLLPGFIYITYQNFGNDPKWLIPFAAAILALRPTEEEYQEQVTPLTVVALAAVVLILPSVLTMALSPFRHISQSAELYEPMLPALPKHSDIKVRIDRGNTMTALVFLDQREEVWAKYGEVIERPEAPEVAGITIPKCEVLAGTSAWFKEITSDLVAANIPAGSQLFTTDILTAFWLFGPFDPLQDGAPWYYGDLSGIENANYVLVPKCSFVDRVFGIMLDELNAADLDLVLVRNNELYALYQVN